jgi:3-isopropylmalate/(R)-2-methylmalate dehydratase small subunit
MNNLRGRVWKFGNNIDTDVIFPSQYMLLPTLDEMKCHTFEPLVDRFSEKVTAGDIIVAGDNFGCGSSREQAVLVLKGLHIGCIIARSFARIFYRNAINTGLLPVTCREIYDHVRQNDRLVVDLAKNSIWLENESGGIFRFNEFPRHIRAIRDAGGLLEFINTMDRETRGRGK